MPLAAKALMDVARRSGLHAPNRDAQQARGRVRPRTRQTAPPPPLAPSDPRRAGELLGPVPSLLQESDEESAVATDSGPERGASAASVSVRAHEGGGSVRTDRKSVVKGKWGVVQWEFGGGGGVRERKRE